MPKPIVGITTATRRIDTVLGLAEPNYTIGVEYLDAVRAGGGIPIALPTFDSTAAADVIARLDGLLLSGGTDIEPSRYGAAVDGALAPDPARDAWEIALADAAWEIGLPILGICRGAQLLNVSRGGTLDQDIWGKRADHAVLSRPGQTVQDHGEHLIHVVPGSMLADVYSQSTRRVNTLHHQALDRIGDGLVVTARASDGTVEAVESATGSAIAVQWHPERMAFEEEAPLFRTFVGMAAGYVTA